MVFDISQVQLDKTNELRRQAGLLPLDPSTYRLVPATFTVLGPTGAPATLSNQDAINAGFIDNSGQLTISGQQNFNLSKLISSAFSNLVTNNNNLISLGNSSTDISKALANAQAQEQQDKAQTYSDIGSLSAQVQDINKRVSNQLIDLGKSVSDASKSASDKGFLQNFGAALGLGTVGAAVAIGLIVLLVLRK